MRIVRTVSAFAVLMAGITALFCLMFLKPGFFSPQKKPGVTVIETRSSIPEQYPSANDLRQNDEVGPNHSLNPILKKKSDAMAANERKMMMYAIKTMDDPFNNGQ